MTNCHKKLCLRLLFFLSLAMLISGCDKVKKDYGPVAQENASAATMRPHISNSRVQN